MLNLTFCRTIPSSVLYFVLHRTIQNEFYAVAFRKKLYQSLEDLQTDLDEWIKEYNEQRTHTGKYCFGKTPWETFQASKELAMAKMVDQNYQP